MLHETVKRYSVGEGLKKTSNEVSLPAFLVSSTSGQIQTLTTHTRTNTQPVTSYEGEGVEEMIGAEGEGMFASHAQRLRVRRLRWLYRFIEDREEGILAENLRYELMGRFGLSYRTSGEYIRTLAGARLIVNNYGRWVSRKQFEQDPNWSLTHKSQVEDNYDCRQLT
jgi:hypothetical protein